MPRPPKRKEHPVFGAISPSDYGRTRAALRSAGTPNVKSIIGNSAGELTRLEVARRIIRL